ncbi:hypothetical protein ABVC73_08180 [Prevotella melaninogenica]
MVIYRTSHKIDNQIRKSMKKGTWRKQHKWLGIGLSFFMLMFCEAVDTIGVKPPHHMCGALAR